MTQEEFLALFPGNHFYSIGRKKPKYWQDKGIVKYNADWNKNKDVYFLVNQTTGSGRRIIDNIARLRAVWLEDDSGKSTDFPLPPTVIVESSPGKRHVYWLFNKSLPINDYKEEWDAVMGHICTTHHGDKSAKDAARVLRVPDTVNQKYEDKPVCKVLSHTDKRYTWEEVVKAFPPCAKSSTVTHIGTASKFNPAQAWREFITGEVVHNSRVSLAMHYANKGLDAESILTILSEQLEDMIEQGVVDRGRGYERLAIMREAAESAVNKRLAEGVSPDYIPIGNRVNIYTDLPPPPAGLALITESIMKYMYLPNKDMALVVAQHIVGLFSGGLSRYDTKTTSRKRTILADSGTGKSIAGDYMSEIIRLIKINKVGSKEIRILEPENYIGTNSFNLAVTFHTQLKQHRIRSLTIHEVGELGKSKSGANPETKAFLLNLQTSNYKATFSPTKIMSSRTQENKAINESLTPLWGVVPLILSESVPDSYAQLLRSADAFRNGEVGREEIIFINPHVPSDNEDAYGDIDPLIVGMIIAAIKSFEDLELSEGNNPANPEGFKALDTSQIDSAMVGLKVSITARRNKAEGFVKKSLLSRMTEKIKTTILTCANADAMLYAAQHNEEFKSPVATEEHFKFAVAYHAELERSLVAQTQEGVFAQPMEICVLRVEKRLSTFGSTAYDKAQPEWGKGIITEGWFTKALDRANFAAADIMVKQFREDRKRFNYALAELCMDHGMVNELPSKGRKRRWAIDPTLLNKSSKEARR